MASGPSNDEELLSRIINTEQTRYQNIFGGQNTLDQVMNQVSQNIECSRICEASQENQDGEQNSQNLKIQSQEDKDDELMKNISNYSNLLEQQLFFDKNDPLASVDTSAASNIVMTNLSDEPALKKQSSKAEKNPTDFGSLGIMH